MSFRAESDVNQILEFSVGYRSHNPLPATIVLASTDHSAKTLAAHIAAMMNARLEAHLECIGDAMRDAVAANRT